jgi:prepilin signal peptidase PulO-like enzyme (type II secretory pathway)
MSAPTIPVSEPRVDSEPTSEVASVERRPLAELLPTGANAALVIAMSIAGVAGSFVDFGLTGRALLGAVLVPVLVLLAAIDMKHRLLPNTIILVASLAVGVIVAAGAPDHFLTHLAAGAALGGFFFLFAAIFAGSLGMGDAKLGFLLGLALGAKTLGAALIAFAGLLVAALYILASRGASAGKDAIPFGPFLALGGIVAFFLGQGI